MSHSEIWKLIEEGGRPTWPSDPDKRLEIYSSLDNPKGVERIGSALARILRASDPNVVMYWEDSGQLVLAHVVARELGARVVQAYDASGVLGVEGNLRSADRVALISDAVRDASFVHQMAAIVRNHGADPVTLAVVMATPELDSVSEGVPTLSLVQPRQG